MVEKCDHLWIENERGDCRCLNCGAEGEDCEVCGGDGQIPVGGEGIDDCPECGGERVVVKADC